ncbi:MAG: sensor domain-containing diguanylate cyclase [Pyrinomonadaceae bacterium]
MDNSETDNLSKNNSVFFADSYFVLALISLCALVATFVVSNFNQTFQAKILIFSAIIFAYLLFCFFFYNWQKQKARQREKEISDSIFNGEIENRLLALEEAGTFFGASLKFPDMFRLVSSRINELIPFTTCALFLVNENNTDLKVVCAVGENTRDLLNFEMSSHRGLAGKTFLSQKIQHEEKLLSDKKVLPDETLKGLESGLAVPLFRSGDVFGVLTLYGTNEIDFSRNSVQLIEAVGTRVAPLFLSSMSFERSLTNALTDTLTSLPNERAFYLVLENQIAESQRNRDERPLTVLTVDIKNFTELNQKFGHATGDQILASAANTIKSQLRQMDFLARSLSDEFLAVLPTASGAVTREIIERIEKAFIFNPFEISPQEKINLQLNFGAATFWKDGETAQQLLQNAHLRKQQAKSGQSSKVIWFPKEYVN